MKIYQKWKKEGSVTKLLDRNFSKSTTMSDKTNATVFADLTNRLMCFAVTENASTEKILLTIEEYEMAASIYR